MLGSARIAPMLASPAILDTRAVHPAALPLLRRWHSKPIPQSSAPQGF